MNDDITDRARKPGGLVTSSPNTIFDGCADKEGEDNMVHLPGCRLQPHCSAKRDAGLDMWVFCSVRGPCFGVVVPARKVGGCTPPHLTSIQREP